ncbi:MAG TPA: DUF3016 domain-containing protein [Opitutales bacterium]|nr:DUF3016 domain-containing protein [Opitutales bacterium]HOO92623.1 DUF3016 domain-containing protein [Opitutales bacterium]
MNKITIWMAAMVACGIANAGNLTVEWVEPKKFRDASQDAYNSESGRARVLKSLEKYFVSEAARIFPETVFVEMAVTEVDLAGMIYPVPDMDKIRVIKQIHPARIHFSYRILDASGAVISEGEEKLRDSTPDSNMRARMLASYEEHPYIKGLMLDWMRDKARSMANASTDADG